MTIPTEPIGSIPRPQSLLDAMSAFAAGNISSEDLQTAGTDAVRDTIERFEAIGSPVITDGEQTKPSFATYPLTGLETLDPDGVVIPFADGHTRQLPKLTARPFHYQVYADSYLDVAKLFAHAPVKQAVIAASVMSLLYPDGASPATHATPSSRTSSTRPKRTSGAASITAPTQCRSISPRDAWQ